MLDGLGEVNALEATEVAGSDDSADVAGAAEEPVDGSKLIESPCTVGNVETAGAIDWSPDDAGISATVHPTGANTMPAIAIKGVVRDQPRTGRGLPRTGPA